MRDGSPTDWVTGRLDRGDVRHYAACLYAAALLIPLGHRRGLDDPLLGYLTSNPLGRRLALARSLHERRWLTRMMLDESLVLCRDDDSLLDLAAGVHDALDLLDAEGCPDPETQVVLRRISEAMAAVDRG